MHDTTVSKENSSKLVKQRTSVVNKRKQKDTNGGRSPNTLDRHRLYKAQPFTIKNINQNMNKYNYQFEQCVN